MADLDTIAAGVARIEGRLEEMSRAHEREIRAVHSRLTETKEDLEEDVKRVERDVRELRKPAAAVGGAVGLAAAGLVEAIRQFFGGSS